MFTLNCNGTLLKIDKPIVMGIINTTPDSFYQDSRFAGIDAVLQQAEKLINEGAAILDVGGQSTNPSSTPIDALEEERRVIPAINALSKRFPNTIISIDSYYATVAQKAVDAGAGIVNDIGGGFLDKEMIPTVAKLNVPYICMHMRGTPATMQQLASYQNITRELLDYFIAKIDECKQAGIKDIILDPGFGFAKTIAHNFELLKTLNVFGILGKPLLFGISRKATIYKTLNITASEALNGTTALNMIALTNGAHLLRVHDVKEALEAITLFEALTVAKPEA